MNIGKQKETTVIDNTQKATPTAEETRLNQIQLGQAEAFDPYQRQMNANAGNLVNMLLTGQALPGYLGGLPGGISPQLTSELSQEAVRDIMPSFQQSGIIDSGVAASIAGRTAGDIRRGAAEFNTGNLLNLLNLAVGGQAQIQQPMLATSGQLGGRLAGLRSISNQGTQTTIGMNPFLRSFQNSAGTALGSNFSGPSWLSAAKGGV